MGSRQAQVAAMLIVSLCLLVSTGCGGAAGPAGGGASAGAAEPKSGAAADTVEVTMEAHVHKVVVPASVEGLEMAVLKSRVEGYVGKVNANIGDSVSRMDKEPMAVLDVPEMKAEEMRLDKMLAKAVADQRLREAERDQVTARRKEYVALVNLRTEEYNRVDGLVRSGALTREKLNEARFALDTAMAVQERGVADVAAAEAMVDAAAADVGVAQAELTKAKVMTSYLNIIAPFDGLVTKRLVDVGAYVEPASNGGSPLFMVERVDEVRIVMYLPMEDAGDLDVGDKADLHSVHGKPFRHFTGEITRLSKSFDRESRMMRVEIDRANPVGKDGKRELLPGDYGKVAITLAEYDGLATVPVTAIGEDSDGKFVVELDADDTYRHRQVIVKATKLGTGNDPDRVGIINADGSPFEGTRVIRSGPATYVEQTGTKAKGTEYESPDNETE